MMAGNMKDSPRKFQETAVAMFRNMGPLLAKARSLSFKKRMMPIVEVDRSNQQIELLKWQQEMFHRILNMMCLVQDGLVHPADLAAIRHQIMRNLIAVHPNGEWPDYTRDKLLFLQDLFQSRCISEEDYHSAKQPLLLRLHEQGAQVDSQDFKLTSNELKQTEESKTPSVSTTTPPVFDQGYQILATEPGDSGPVKKKTPIKHVMDAVSRLKSPVARKMLDLSPSDDKQGREAAKQQRVPHALDFLSPPHCPTRNPPITTGDDQKTHSDSYFESPLFKQSSIGSTRDLLPELSNGSTRDLFPQLSNLSLDDMVSPPSILSSSPGPATQSKAALGQSQSLTPVKLTFTSRSSSLTPSKSSLGLTNSNSKSTLESALSRKFSGFFRGWQKVEQERDSDGDDWDDDGDRAVQKKSMWQRLDLLGAAGSSSRKSEDDDFGKEISEKDPLLAAIEDYSAEKVRRGFINGQGPNAKKLKKKVSVKAAPTNFFIDQVLGENIKSELDRTRQEMAMTGPGNHQTFTNDQIEAIATRLPVDKNELMRFLPKAWCDRYCDVVLDVVHKEFKSHVSEMDGLRKVTKDKRRLKLKDSENDENRKSREPLQSAIGSDAQNAQIPKPPYVKTQASKFPPVTSRVYTTEGFDSTGASVQEPHQQQQTDSTSPPLDVHRYPASAPTSGGRVKRGLGYEELDVKLRAEISRMPFRNFNESNRF